MCASRLFASTSIALSLLVTSGVVAQAQQLTLVNRKPDPHGSPRPAKNAEHVPIRTSLYFELKFAGDGNEDAPADDGILADSVTIRRTAETGEEVEILRSGRNFADGCTGWLRPRGGRGGSDSGNVSLLAVYVDLETPLKPLTRYTVSVAAKTKNGVELTGRAGEWSFATAAATGETELTARVDFGSEPVHWQGQFFSGLCNVLFCSSESYLPTYELMDEARRQHPRAWSFQRDFWMTGLNRDPGVFASTLPNLVRERESRRVRKMEQKADGTLLHVEDFFGHEQYGIESGRPIGEDYHPGDVVLIVDPKQSAQASVISVDDEAGTVLVSTLDPPVGEWKVKYTGRLPTEEDPDMPGLFPPGGCSLIKFKPHGTACYYWGRLDKEWDLQHRRFGRRLLPNFADAPGDLSRDGHNWTAPKDYAQYHATVRDITGHLIDRYGEECLDFTWSVFNEPDLGRLFWRADWDDLQKFYDYTIDGILRAFEDRGLDSERVFVGGLELGGIFGTNLRLREFLAHCSPTASAPGALPLNAAYADERLDGQRSRRVEELCSKHNGQGSPCDFISIHAYNGAELMSNKLRRAKEMALEIDADYFTDLWVNSHECCPEWNLPPDVAAADSYLGNGFAETWCVDVANRQLNQAAQDPRYGFGETLFTVWPPVQNFSGANAVSRNIAVDDDGDGRRDRTATIASPLFHVMTLLSDFGDRYWVLPVHEVGGRQVGGFASRDEEGVVRVMLYAHHAEDPQSRSDARFRYALELTGLPAGGSVHLEEFRIDKAHNSYFERAVQLREGSRENRRSASEQFEGLRSDDPAEQLAALQKLKDSDPAVVRRLASDIARVVQGTTDDAIRQAGRELFVRFSGGKAFPADVVNEVQRKSRLTPTQESDNEIDANGNLTLSAELLGNGLNVLVITPN